VAGWDRGLNMCCVELACLFQTLKDVIQSQRQVVSFSCGRVFSERILPQDLKRSFQYDDCVLILLDKILG
jgi:hypothetical protein